MFNELIVQVFKKIVLFLLKKWSDQVPILHMPWQLSCHDMCKIVTWFDQNNENWSNTFTKFLL